MEIDLLATKMIKIKLFVNGSIVHPVTLINKAVRSTLDINLLLSSTVFTEANEASWRSFKIHNVRMDLLCRSSIDVHEIWN